MTDQILTLIDDQIAKLTFARSLLLGESLPTHEVLTRRFTAIAGTKPLVNGTGYPADWREEAKKSQRKGTKRKPTSSKPAKPTAPKSTSAAAVTPKSRTFSPEAKERMRQAQVTRWKRFYRAKKQAAKVEKARMKEKGAA